MGLKIKMRKIKSFRNFSQIQWHSIQISNVPISRIVPVEHAWIHSVCMKFTQKIDCEIVCAVCVFGCKTLNSRAYVNVSMCLGHKATHKLYIQLRKKRKENTTTKAHTAQHTERNEAANHENDCLGVYLNVWVEMCLCVEWSKMNQSLNTQLFSNVCSVFRFIFGQCFCACEIFCLLRAYSSVFAF